MTALRKYQRLESPGLWREYPEAQLRDVVVGLRETTLILSDPKTEMALAQWSLPALERLNPAGTPALFGPGADSVETLEIDDLDMTAALATVHAALERRRPHPGRLRGAVVGGVGAALAALCVLWLPAKLVDYTAAMLPMATRADLGRIALNDLAKLTGSPCTSGLGNAAAKALAQRINPENPPKILVLRDGLTAATRLPGNLVLLPAAILEKADGPEAVAGYVLVQTTAAHADDGTKALLHYTGLIATMRLLGSGQMDHAAITGFGQSLLTPTQTQPDDDALLAAFQAKGISSKPFAYARDASGETTLDLIEADPFPDGSTPPVLDDASWVSFQSICQD